jgi:hypothetical protein
MKFRVSYRNENKEKDVEIMPAHAPRMRAEKDDSEKDD